MKVKQSPWEPTGVAQQCSRVLGPLVQEGGTGLWLTPYALVWLHNTLQSRNESSSLALPALGLEAPGQRGHINPTQADALTGRQGNNVPWF